MYRLIQVPVTNRFYLALLNRHYGRQIAGRQFHLPSTRAPYPTVPVTMKQQNTAVSSIQFVAASLSCCELGRDDHIETLIVFLF